MTYRGRNEARRARKMSIGDAERRALIEAVEKRCEAKARQQLTQDRERRPFRVPSTELCGFPSERFEHQRDGSLVSEDGTIRVTFLGGKRPDSLEVIVPLDSDVAARYHPEWYMAAVNGDRAMAPRVQMMNCHFVAREQRLKVAPGNYVHFWNWEPKRGGHYPAAVTLHRHLKLAKSYLGQMLESAKWGDMGGVLHFVERTNEVFDRGIAGTSEWIGVEDPTR